MENQLTVAGVQMDIHLGDVQRNLDRVRHWLEDPLLSPAQFVVFPECALTGYAFASKHEGLKSAIATDGPELMQVTDLAREFDKVLALGTLEKEGGHLFNSCFLVGPTGLVGRYRKTHLPFLGADRFSTPGALPPDVFDLGNLRVGVHICYDASFPEASRCLMLAGADLAILPTNWPLDAEVFSKHLAAVRAMENHMYFMVVNRIGYEAGIEFIGKSRLCDPLGRVVAEIPDASESVMLAAIEPGLARQKRIVRVPGEHEIDRVVDRRPDLYGRLLE